MVLSDEINDLIAQGDKPSQPKKCAVWLAIQQFEGDDRVALIHLIDKSKVPAPRVSALLAKHGVEVHFGRVKAHRARLVGTQNRCACPVEM